jgi:hypothetical protein
MYTVGHFWFVKSPLLLGGLAWLWSGASLLMRARMHYVQVARIKIALGVAFILVGISMFDEGEIRQSWMNFVGASVAFGGIPWFASAAELLSGQEGAKVGPGTYYEYRCPHCDGVIRSASVALAGDTECSFCRFTFRAR